MAQRDRLSRSLDKAGLDAHGCDVVTLSGRASGHPDDVWQCGAVDGYSITIFLPDGAPAGLRIARRSHWTGEVLMCPRNLYPAEVHREAFGRTGAYILLGQAEDGTGGVAYTSERATTWVPGSGLTTSIRRSGTT